MNRKRLVGLAVLMPLAFWGTAARAVGEQRPLFRPGELIVHFRPGTPPRSLQGLAAKAHGAAQFVRSVAQPDGGRVALARFPVSLPMHEMAARLAALPDVQSVEPNYLASIPALDAGQGPLVRWGARARDGGATVDPRAVRSPALALRQDGVHARAFAGVNDESSALQAGWFWIDADIVWLDAARNPTIAILDTGVDDQHPDLAGRIIKGKDIVNDDADPDDDNGHGTHVAGAAGAAINNAKGVAGVSTAQLLVIKVLDAQGVGSYFDIAAGITLAAANPMVKVISLSFGGPAPSEVLETALRNAVNRGKLIVVAAGNTGSSLPTYPAGYADADAYPALAPQVMAIAAGGARHYVDCPGPACFSFIDYSCKAPYSNYGSWISAIAPGTLIYSTTPTGEFWLNTYAGVARGYAYLSGTSMAAPLVAGAAARVFSAMPPATTAAQVKARLVSTGFTDVAHGNEVQIDTDGDGDGDTPCWPLGTNTEATAVDVAAAMKRAAAVGTVFDANGGLSPKGATVQPFLGAAPRGAAGAVDTTAVGGSGFNYRVLNIPAHETAPYDFKVSRPGYTAGAQTFTSLPVDGSDVFVYPEQVSIAANDGNLKVITDWATNAEEIDQYLFLPSAAPLPCSVGYLGSCGIGSLAGAPFVRWHHDGGPSSGGAAVELTTLRFPLQPTGAGTPYKIVLTDYRAAGTTLYFSSAVTRIWRGGAIQATVRAFPAGAGGSDIATHGCTLGGGTTECNAWYVGDLSGAGVFAAKNIFGVFDTPAGHPHGVLPYNGRERTGDGSPRRGDGPPASRRER